jgi:uncharacterized protein
MARSSCIELSAAEREPLLQIARKSVHSGVDSSVSFTLALQDLPQALRVKRAVFVTLSSGGTLRGCIGSLEASQPLARAVAEAAHGAAFRDPRFAPLQAHELDHISIEISVLSAMEPMPVSSRAELLAALQPARDGLLLQEGQHRATFLPHVWRQLPDPDIFFNHLLTKAGLPVGYWSPHLTFFRYQTLSFSETASALPCSRGNPAPA